MVHPMNWNWYLFLAYTKGNYKAVRFLSWLQNFTPCKSLKRPDTSRHEIGSSPDYLLLLVNSSWVHKTTAAPKLLSAETRAVLRWRMPKWILQWLFQSYPESNQRGSKLVRRTLKSNPIQPADEVGVLTCQRAEILLETEPRSLKWFARGLPADLEDRARGMQHSPGERWPLSAHATRPNGAHEYPSGPVTKHPQT